MTPKSSPEKPSLTGSAPWHVLVMTLTMLGQGPLHTGSARHPCLRAPGRAPRTVAMPTTSHTVSVNAAWGCGATAGLHVTKGRHTRWQQGHWSGPRGQALSALLHVTQDFADLANGPLYNTNSCQHTKAHFFGDNMVNSHPTPRLGAHRDGERLSLCQDTAGRP